MVVGGVELYINEGVEQHMAIEDTFIHPDHGDLDNDICLVKVKIWNQMIHSGHLSLINNCFFTHFNS